MTEQTFGEVALRLAGLAGWHLGWSADRFWNATPREMEVVVRAMLGADESGAGLLMVGECAPSAGEIARLQEMFPDG
ncbi:MAG: phage tail assembly chaperone [Sphingobium sp.]